VRGSLDTEKYSVVILDPEMVQNVSRYFFFYKAIVHFSMGENNRYAEKHRDVRGHRSSFRSSRDRGNQ
jgi:hypothetical protein